MRQDNSGAILNVFFIPRLFSFFENQIDFGARLHPQRHSFTPHGAVGVAINPIGRSPERCIASARDGRRRNVPERA
jgi:hypothetical protein